MGNNRAVFPKLGYCSISVCLTNSILSFWSFWVIQIYSSIWWRRWVRARKKGKEILSQHDEKLAIDKKETVQTRKGNRCHPEFISNDLSVLITALVKVFVSAVTGSKILAEVHVLSVLSGEKNLIPLYFSWSERILSRSLFACSTNHSLIVTS